MILLLYYLWNFFSFIIYLNLKYINFLFLKFNKFNLIFKKSFNNLTFFERYILIFFSKNNWFFKSVCGFSNFYKDILDKRKNEHPLINFFFFYFYKKNFFCKNIFDVKFIFNKLKNKEKNNFLEFLLKFRIIYNTYNNLSYNYLEKINNIKFHVFKKKFNKLFFNLNFYNDWYKYSFDNKNYFNSFNKIFDKNKINNLKNKKLFYYKKTNSFLLKILNKNYIYFKFELFNLLERLSLKKNLKNYFILPVRFSNSSINKYISNFSTNNYNFLYLRKNRIFNKGRYSRNRQLYRTGVYWCLWLNIIIVYGLYFLFYRFTFNFGYIWIGLFLLFFSFIFSRIVKYNFFNIFILFKEFFYFFNWFYLFFKNLNSLFFFFLKDLTVIINLNKLIFNYLNIYIYKFFFYVSFLLKKLKKKKDYGFVYLWQNYNLTDNSFLKYKSILNWFIQFYKVLVY